MPKITTEDITKREKKLKKEVKLLRGGYINLDNAIDQLDKDLKATKELLHGLIGKGST